MYVPAATTVPELLVPSQIMLWVPASLVVHASSVFTSLLAELYILMEIEHFSDSMQVHVEVCPMCGLNGLGFHEHKTAGGVLSTTTVLVADHARAFP